MIGTRQRVIRPHVSTNTLFGLFIIRSHDFDVFQAVFQDAGRIAAEIAKAYKAKQSEFALDNNESVVGQKRVVANWDWLDFGDRTELDR